MFCDLVAACDSEIDASFTDEGWDVCCGEEDECNGEVLDQGNVEARVAVELDVGALEQVEADLVKTALCARLLVLAGYGGVHEMRTLGDCEK